MNRNAPRNASYPPARPPRRQVDEYSESEREESEYETDGEDIEHSPTRGREDELDEEDEYEEDVEEAPLSDEEMQVRFLGLEVLLFHLICIAWAVLAAKSHYRAEIFSSLREKKSVIIKYYIMVNI
jgi:hypothetical protein